MLLERDDELAALTQAVRGIGTRPGAVVAVTGEPGAGKSTLVRAACDHLPARVLRGLCDPLSTPRPLGPIRDVVLDARATVAAPTDRADSLVRYSEDLVAVLGSEATVVVVEDSQWIDEASVDVLRFVVRRIETLPVVVLLTYRDGEIDAGHTLRPLLGDLARLEHATTMHLEPLTVDAIATLVDGTGLDARAVHDLTGGNPFFASEIARHPDAGLPPSVRDAVLASTSALDAADVSLLQLLAAAPDGIDHRLLPRLGIDLPTLRRLDRTGLLARSARSVRYHHELGRLAVESSVPPGGVPGLHAQLLGALELLDDADPAVLTHHAVAAGDRARAGHHARVAAEQAAGSASHGEAAAFFEVALDQLDDEPPAERARLHERLAFERYMTNRLPEAIASVDEALALWSLAGDTDGVAGAHSRRAQFEYYSGRRAEAERDARRATVIAGDGRPRLPYGMALSMRGYLAFRQNDLVEAAACNAEAIEVGRQLDAHDVRLQSAIVDGMGEVVGGSIAARPTVAGLIDEAKHRSIDEVASMGMSNLAMAEIEQRRYRAADEVLAAALPFTVERDIAICNQVQTGLRSRLHLGRGRWSAAIEDAATVIDTGGAPIAQVWPHVVSAIVPLRAGVTGTAAKEAAEHLDAAWELAQQLGEVTVLLPVLAAVTEQVWLTGADDPRTATIPAALREASAAPGTSWSVGELAIWFERIGGSADRDLEVAPPFRLVLEGRFRDAADAWHEIGDPYEEALARVQLDEADDVAAGLALLDQMGATASADRCRQDLRRRGVATVPARRRASTRANPSGLTNRQLEVARLLAQGLTNAELARQLYISEKTADHHVSAVLAKLHLASRREVAKHAGELGLV